MLVLPEALSIHEHTLYVKVSNHEISDDLETFKSQFQHFTMIESIFFHNIMVMKCGGKPSDT